MVNYLRKITLVTFLIIALTFSLPFISVQGSLAVGDVFEYEIQKAYGNFNYTNTTATVSGQTDQFRIGDTPLDVGDEFTVQVEGISTGVQYSIYDSTKTLLRYASVGQASFNYQIFKNLIYPFAVLGMASASVGDPNVSLGVSLGDNLYVAPPLTNWNQVYNLYNDVTFYSAFIGGFGSDEGNLTIDTAATWYDGGDTVAFEIDMSGTYIITAESTQLGIIHSVRFDYNVSNHALLGYDMFTLISGDYQGLNTNFAMTVQITETSYTRVIGVPFILVGFMSVLIASVIVLVRKRPK